MIDGLVDVPFLTSDLLTSDERIEMTILPAPMLIVGGGYIALELGQMFRRFGVEVTILERSAVTSFARALSLRTWMPMHFVASHCLRGGLPPAR